MNCIVSTKRKEKDGSYTVLVTCLQCGYSMRISNEFVICTCLNCATKLEKSEYLTKKKLEVKIENIKKQMMDEMQAVERTIAMGFSPANPFRSYRKTKKKYDRIAAVPNIIKKMKKKQ